MKKVFAIALLSLGFSSAAGFIGTKQSFFESSFCKTYKCKHVETKDLGEMNSARKGQKMFSYSVDMLYGPVMIDVLRVNNVTTGINAIPTDFDEYSPDIRKMFLTLVRFASGSDATQLLNKCYSEYPYFSESMKHSYNTTINGKRSVVECIGLDMRYHGGDKGLMFSVGHK